MPEIEQPDTPFCRTSIDPLQYMNSISFIVCEFNDYDGKRASEHMVACEFRLVKCGRCGSIEPVHNHGEFFTNFLLFIFVLRTAYGLVFVRYRFQNALIGFFLIFDVKF